MRQPNTNEITVAPNITDLDVTNSFELLSNDTTLRQALPPETISDSEISAAIDYRNTFKQGDVITALNVFFSNINNVYFRQADFSIENILYWYQKLKNSNKEITSYRSQVSYYGDNILNNQLPSISRFSSNAYNSGSFSYDNYFNNVSDSIGIIANSKYLQLDSTLPLFDINQEYYGVPVPYSASLENKISANTRNVMYDLSQKTTTYMRHNLMGVGYTNLTLQQNLAADASTSHGLNLINDLPTFVAINESLGMLKDKLASVFAEAKIFGFIQYVSNIANQTAMNLRDIFPVASDDKDFVVVTSEERANASQAIRDQEVSDALAEQTLYAQQQNFELAGSSIYGNLQPLNTGSSSNSPIDAASIVTPDGAVVPGTGGSKFVNGKLLGDGTGGVPDSNELGSAVTLEGRLRVDTDGAPGNPYNDPDWQPETSLRLNGTPVDASKVPYVVVSPNAQKEHGIKTGDWALVTNQSNKQQVWARVADVGPRGASAGEMSAAAATALGVRVGNKGFPSSEPKMSVSYYPNSRSLTGRSSTSQQYVAGSTTPPTPGSA